MYAKWIDVTRKVVAVLFAVLGIGFAISNNLRCDLGITILGYCTLACLVAAFGLYIESLIRWWLGVRPGGLKASQFSLAELLAATAALAIFLGLFRIFGAAMVVISILAIVVLGCFVELARRRSEDSQGVGLVDGRAEPHSTGSVQQESRSSQWRRWWHRLGPIVIAVVVCYVLVLANQEPSKPIPLGHPPDGASSVASDLPTLGNEYGWPWTYRLEANDAACNKLYCWGLVGDVLVGLAIVGVTAAISQWLTTPIKTK